LEGQRKRGLEGWKVGGLEVMKKLIVFIVIMLSFSLSFAEQRFIIPLEDSPSHGPKNAPVTIIEFIDFQ